LKTRSSTLAVFAVALAGGIAGCGGSSSNSGTDNGVAAKSPDAIVNAATNAVNTVKTVHVLGSLRSEGSPITLDLTLVAGKGGGGQMTQNGLSFRLINLNQTVYINGSDAFWRHIGGSGAAQLFHGKWLRATANGQFAAVASLTNVQTLFNQLLSNHGNLAKGQTTTVAGRKVVAVIDTTKGGTLYVATTGQPYPVQVSKKGSNGGQVVFDRYNQPATLTAPPDAIDVSKLR
jgi:hypothetical protein